MALISREYARSLFADLAQNAMVPLDPDELLHMPDLRWHGHVFFGDTAVRCYKHKARWMYDERDIRAAGQVFAELHLDLDDTVEVQLPAYGAAGEHGSEEWRRPDWRRRLLLWMIHAARHKLLQEERPYEEWDAWTELGANGLPGDLSWEELLTSSSQYRHWQNIAGTRPLQLLTRPGESWLLPRTYAELLDRWEQREEELLARARLCSSCGVQGPYWNGWRTSTSKGYVTRCPPCSGAALQLYAGHLRGVQYESLRGLGTRADLYLCRLCQQSQASAWDHCHEHGHVRGPLCGSCNTREGVAAGNDFVRTEGSVLHLLQCWDCFEQGTLPRRHHAGVVRAYLANLVKTERCTSCRSQPYLTGEVEHSDGAYRAELRCSRWQCASQWTMAVAQAEAAALVQAAVDTALATTGEDQPSPMAVRALG